MDLQVVAVQNGTQKIRIGRIAMDEPEVTIDNVVGLSTSDAGETGNVFFEQQVNHPDVLERLSPLIAGQMVNDRAMQEILKYLLVDKLHSEPSLHPMIITESPVATRSPRETMTEMLFETFECPAAYLANQSVMEMYSCGHWTGLVLDAGYTLTYAVPIFEGLPLPHATTQSYVAGEYLTRALRSLMRRYSCPSGLDYATIKEAHCHTLRKTSIPLEATAEFGALEPNIFKMPDGTEIDLREEAVTIPEILLYPRDIKRREASGLADIARNALIMTDKDIRGFCVDHVILASGSCQFKGLKSRMKDELALFRENGSTQKIQLPANHKISAWIGCGVVCRLAQFGPHWMSKNEYLEWGPNLVQRKCIF